MVLRKQYHRWKVKEISSKLEKFRIRTKKIENLARFKLLVTWWSEKKRTNSTNAKQVENTMRKLFSVLKPILNESRLRKLIWGRVRFILNATKSPEYKPILFTDKISVKPIPYQE